MRKTLVFFLFITTYLISCTSESENRQIPFDEGPVVSVVNGDSVSAEFFQQAYIQHILKTGRNDTREERYQFLGTLTDDLLLAQQAEKYEVLDSSYVEYMDQVKRISVADRFFSSSFLDSLSLPSEAQIEAAFFNTKIKLHVSHLFFTDGLDAQKAYQRLQDGETFLDLANEIYNTPRYDSTAGYIGEISYFNVDDAFGEAAYKLKAGEYSPPVQSRQGYHIIYVNNRIGNPIMTQAEFEYKKQGIKGLTKERIKTIKGDAFVRTYMQSLDVNVDPKAVEKLHEALRQISTRSSANAIPAGIPQDISSYPNSAEVEFVRQELQPGTPLASYTHLGEQMIFTAGDYFSWLKTIPLEEAQTKTMASVGRALRNQVFYEAGSEKNLFDDPIVQYNIDFKDKFYRAYLVKQYLADQPVPEIPLEEQKAAFMGMGMNTGKNRTFTGWVITAKSLREAREIKSEVESGNADPESFEFFESFKNSDIRQVYALQSQVLRAPLNIPVVANAKDSFYVLKVTERDIDRVEFEEAQDRVVERMTRYYNIVNELRQLRSEAEISVDTAAFENLMEHLDDPSLKGQRSKTGN